MTVYDVAAKLPPIDVLRDRCKALAVLERIIDGGEPLLIRQTLQFATGVGV
ncbi:hypothetical protein KZZ52_26975 [Dactylosporangium sp. AC04546]|uniref:hypothetical protein n=1 Tax=Dactylosporangium sp. AC04546 TaxID=2862460 RepID=UPI001EDF62B3|nr:hypothetical protein [Dactylosporangium sp. AC04546]WVK88910.1 hypothetical protein KZZ52_26975 [Dactylosporangium sp. AC04546]